MHVQGLQGCLGGVQVKGGFMGAKKKLKTRKTRKMLRSCVATLLRSYIHDLVQEVLRVPPFSAILRGYLSTVSNTPPKSRRISIFVCTHVNKYIYVYVYLSVHIYIQLDVYVYICIYVYIYICIFPSRHLCEQISRPRS